MILLQPVLPLSPETSGKNFKLTLGKRSVELTCSSACEVKALLPETGTSVLLVMRNQGALEDRNRICLTPLMAHDQVCSFPT